MLSAAALAAKLLQADNSPLPDAHPSTPLPKVDADLVTPGLLGFFTLFLSALAVFFLARSMARRVQRVNHRARLQGESLPDIAADSAKDGDVGRPTVNPPTDGPGDEGERKDLHGEQQSMAWEDFKPPQ